MILSTILEISGEVYPFLAWYSNANSDIKVMSQILSNSI